MKILSIKKTLYLVSIFSVLSSCANKDQKIIKADLSFRSISFTSAHGASKEEYNKFIKKVDSVIKHYESSSTDDNEKVSSYQNYLLSKHIVKLDRLNLFHLPHIYLHFGKDSIMEVYISEKEYKKIKDFNQVELYREKKKVTLELQVEEKDSGIYYSDNIINIKKVDGKSRSNVFKEN